MNTEFDASTILVGMLLTNSRSSSNIKAIFSLLKKKKFQQEYQGGLYLSPLLLKKKKKVDFILNHDI